MDSSSINGLSPSPIALDAHGNVVDLEPLLAIGLSGIWALRRRLFGPAPVSLRLWAEGSLQVGGARRELEAAFGRLSNGLEKLLAVNGESLRLARGSVHAGLGGEAGSSSLVIAAQLCTAALRYNEQNQARSAHMRDSLGDLEKMSRQIHLMVTEIQEHMRPAEVVQVLLRIECARLEDSARAPLEALSAEISRACGKMARTMEAEFELVEQTRATVEHMVDYVRKLENRQAEGTRRRDELAAEMQQLHERALAQLDRDQVLNRISSELDRAVGGLIEAMQYQDIVGQRWQHVEDGFRGVAAGGWADRDTLWSAQVQQAQLAEANAEMAEALCRIEDSLAVVAEAEQTLVEEIDAVIADAGRQKLNVRLHAVLFEVWDMARTNQEEMLAIDHLITPLLDVAGKMGCQIGDVSHEMRIIALNSQVQAARFGAGTGLEVLAEGLRQIADRMGDSGATLDRDSREIEAIAQSLRAGFVELGERLTQVRFECDRDFPAVISRLTEEEQRVKTLLGEARKSLECMAAVRRDMGQSLGAAAEPLERLGVLAQQTLKFVEKNVAPSRTWHDRQVLAAESARYTMESENAVLRNIAGEAAKPEPAKVAPGELDLF
jgi:hypothetical protein